MFTILSKILSFGKEFSLSHYPDFNDIKTDGLNGVLRHFLQYFSHITATAHVIHAFLGFTSTMLGSEVSCPRTLP